MAQWFVIVALAYLLGAIPTGIWIARILGVADLRKHGSGSAGATNVLRTIGWKAALTVAALDAAKGWVAVALLPRIGDAAAEPTWLSFATGIAAVVGHVWPVLAGFRGGKGVATTGGTLLAIAPPVFAACLAVFLIVAAVGRRASVASLASAACLPVFLYLLPAGDAAGSVAFGSTVLAVVALTHRSNIRNLLDGNEPRIGMSKRGEPG